jgi:hypothetical protein
LFGDRAERCVAQIERTRVGHNSQCLSGRIEQHGTRLAVGKVFLKLLANLQCNIVLQVIPDLGYEIRAGNQTAALLSTGFP